MNVNVKSVGLDELDLLMEWRMRVLQEVFSLDRSADLSALRANNVAYYQKHLSQGSHTACFAVDSENGRIVGCGGICYQREMPSPDNPSGQNGYLMNVYTLPELRGEGIGRAIVAFLTKDATKRGTGKIYLESSETGRSLYRELGFRELRDYMVLEKQEKGGR